MFCPNCGSQFSEGQKFCRTCGTNLAIISKAVTLSDAIGRSDRGAMPKIKAAIENLNLGQAPAEISKGLEQMSHEIERGFHGSSRRHRRQKSPEEKREHYIVNGFISLFTGVGLAVFLYYIAGAIHLNIPPERAARIPFEIEPLIRSAWLVGLIPALAGLGRIIGGLLIRPLRPERAEALRPPQPMASLEPPTPSPLGSVTEHTTELLDSSDANASARNVARQRE
jgi:hypothetical protein